MQYLINKLTITVGSSSITVERILTTHLGRHTSKELKGIQCIWLQFRYFVPIAICLVRHEQTRIDIIFVFSYIGNDWLFVSLTNIIFRL